VIQQIDLLDGNVDELNVNNILVQPFISQQSQGPIWPWMGIIFVSIIIVHVKKLKKGNYAFSIPDFCVMEEKLFFSIWTFQATNNFRCTQTH
jgi:hypothetical protein